VQHTLPTPYNNDVIYTREGVFLFAIMECMNTQEQELFLEWLKTTDLPNTSEVLSILAERLWKERQKNNGLIPFTVFNPSIGMSGNYTTVIAVPKVVAADGTFLGYAHKKREAGDDGWSGYYHQPGTLMWTTQPNPFRDTLVRLTGELFGQEYSKKDTPVTELGFVVEELPISFVWESFRRAFATRIAFFVTIPEEVYEQEMKQNSGKEWQLVADPYDTNLTIVPFELLWLQYAVQNPEPYKLIIPPEDVVS
jgi:hypothetical protein